MNRLRSDPLRRFERLHRGYHSLWPVLMRAASLYRKTVTRRTRVVAVVGSFGKSTAARCLAAALGCDVDKLSQRNAGSFVARAVLGIRPGQEHAVVEVGVMCAGQMGPYARMIRPDVTVVTSVGSEHNRSFQTLEVTRSEKADMVRALRNGGIAVLNGDDPNVLWMASETHAVVRTFGMNPGNHVRASEIELDWPGGTRFLLHAEGTVHRVHVRLVGRVMVYPVLAAVAVALEEGIPLERVLPALEALEPTPGRLEPMALPNGAVILRDDYKSALETMVSALDVLSQVPARRRIAVLGEVTEPQGSLGTVYRDLGERLGRSASKVYLFCAGNRYRDYLSGAIRAGLPSSSVIRVGGGILDFIEKLRGELGGGDVVLVKGRTQQRLGRIALALGGRTVRCGVGVCPVKATICTHCPNLERG